MATLTFEKLSEAFPSLPEMLFTEFDKSLLGIMYYEPVLLLKIEGKQVHASFSLDTTPNLAAVIALELKDFCKKAKYELRFIKPFLLFEDKALFGEEAVGLKLSFLTGKLKLESTLQ